MVDLEPNYHQNQWGLCDALFSNYFEDLLYMPVVADAWDWVINSVFHFVCVCVCMCVRAVKGKWLELSTAIKCFSQTFNLHCFLLERGETTSVDGEWCV